MNNKLVSIIIPVYNTEDYIKNCLFSVINQSYNNLEIIVVNDGSKDKSDEIIKRIKNEDSRIKYHIKSNGGLSSARNYGLDVASGEYVVFLDSDDALDLNYVETMYKTMVDNSVDIVACNRNKNGKEAIYINKTTVMNRETSIKEYLKGSYFFPESCCVKFYKMSLFDNIRFPEGRIHEDTFTTYKLLNAINNTAYIDYNGYIVNERQLSITRSPFSNRNYDVVIACKEIFNFYKSYNLFSQLAFDKYLGSILYFILKTNKINLENNKKAYQELDILLKNINHKIKYKYLPFIILHKFNMLRYFSL